MEKYKVISFYEGEVVASDWFTSKFLAKSCYWLVSKLPWFTTQLISKEFHGD